jgi:hypothetical protein
MRIRILLPKIMRIRIHNPGFQIWLRVRMIRKILHVFTMWQVTVLQQAEASGGSVSKEMLAASLGWDTTR